jgi:glycine cleavage system aminomethyltransferase T
MAQPQMDVSNGNGPGTARFLALYRVIESAGIPSVRAWQFSGWKAESMSWKAGCYIHPGLSGTGPLSLKEPDAERFLEILCINSFAKFPVVTTKHAVMCNEDGLISCHGITEQEAEDEFEIFTAPPWPLQELGGTSYKAEAHRHNDYLFQIAGPTSLKTLEKVTDESPQGHWLPALPGSPHGQHESGSAGID